MRNEYILDRLVNNSANQIICVDESLFMHKEGNQTWIIGLLNTETNGIRLDVVTIRNETTLKAIIEKHAGIGKEIYSDSWTCYNFLNRPNSGYINNVVNHSQGVFGITRMIEGLSAVLNSLIKKMYTCIHSINLIYFLREAEYRRNTRNVNTIEKLDSFSIIVSTVDFNNFISEEDLINIDYKVFYDDKLLLYVLLLFD